MSIPQFAPFPQAKDRASIPLQEWRSYLESWTSLSELYLRLNVEDFTSALQSPSLGQFLRSFFQELAEDPTLQPDVVILRKKCFLVLHRIWSGNEIPNALLDYGTISNVCRAFAKSEQLRILLRHLWKRQGPKIESTLQTAKISLIKSLESKDPEGAEGLLSKLVPLLKMAPDAGVYMLVGSDFLDSLNSAYTKTSSSSFQKKLVMVAYLGLAAVLEGEKPNYSLLTDHLYSLKTSAEKEQKADATKKIVLADLVTNTPLLSKIRDSATTPEAARLKNIAASLSTFQQAGITRPKRLVRRKVDKGKGKAKEDEFGHGAFGEVHVHRMSLISQIQDLFPDLGSGFVVKLLDEYHDSVEEVISHLLEDSLPPKFADADRSEQLPAPTSGSHSHLPPRSTPPQSTTPPPAYLQRRNIFDNDELDRLAVDTSRLHIGRRNAQLTADQLLSDRSAAPNKSAILSALAAFDSDDDERDDTYDVEDVGGLVDSTPADEADADKNQEALFRAYSMTPEVFGREAETRRGKARAALKSETGMTDEAIEGWGIMFSRDPKRRRRLEAKFNTFSGQQRGLDSTAYRSSPADSGEEASGQGQRGGRGGFEGRGRGRGRGRGGRGGGGNVAGPADDKGTQGARRGKEANKGSRANHNRRDQRARKVARAGFPG